MADLQDHILFKPSLSPEARKALEDACAQDPDLRQSLDRWWLLQHHLAEQLKSDMPHRDLLVAYALSQKYGSKILSETERAALTTASPEIDRQVSNHPGLAVVCKDIQQGAKMFDSLWDHHFPSENTPARHSSKKDRLPVPGIRKDRTLQRWAWRISVPVVILVFAFLLSSRWQSTPNLITVQTGAHETRLVLLADGSSVRLMPESSLSYKAFSESGSFNRSVNLTGRGFFEVSPKPIPFSVRTENATTTVLGTTFGIVADQPQKTRVILVKGSVTLSSNDRPESAVTLKPGEASDVLQNNKPLVPEKVDLLTSLNWTGQFVCYNTPLPILIAHLSSHFNRKIEIEEGLSEETITGTFDQNNTLESTLNLIATATGGSLTVNHRNTFKLIR